MVPSGQAEISRQTQAEALTAAVFVPLGWILQFTVCRRRLMGVVRRFAKFWGVRDGG